MAIKINVGGTIFETTEIILRKISYFNDLLSDTNLNVNDILFVNRPAHIFKHVLALAIDDTYKYPKKYLNELGFYGVTCNVETIYDPFLQITKDLTELKGKFEIMYKSMPSENCILIGCENEKTSGKYCENHKCKCDYVVGNHYSETLYCKNNTIAMKDGHYRCHQHYKYDI